MREPDKRVLAPLVGAVVLALGFGTPPSRGQSPCLFIADDSAVIVAGRAFVRFGESVREFATLSDACFSCHDGSVAANVPVQMRANDEGATRGAVFSNPRRFAFGEDKHPVDVRYPSGDPEYVPRHSLDHRLRLQGDLVTCQTCHGDGSTRYGLSIPIVRSELCLSCHRK